MTTSHAEGWSEHRTETLKRLWLDGLSASQVAMTLGGGVTRNAVLGKVHRLGIVGRGTPSAPRGNARQDRRTGPRTPRPSKPNDCPAAARNTLKPRIGAVITSRPTERVYVERHTPSLGLIGLSSRTCKWPIGDPQADDFGFCGRRVETGPYCSDHAVAAYRPGGRTSTASLLKLAGL